MGEHMTDAGPIYKVDDGSARFVIKATCDDASIEINVPCIGRDDHRAILIEHLIDFMAKLDYFAAPNHRAWQIHQVLG